MKSILGSSKFAVQSLPACRKNPDISGIDRGLGIKSSQFPTSNSQLLLKWLFFFSFYFNFYVDAPLSAQIKANFTADKVSGCSPIQINFTDASTGSPTSRSWNFGNGKTSDKLNPSTVYVTPGTYTVTLTVTKGSTSNVEQKKAYITVFANPVAGFKINTPPVCVGQSVNFTDNSTLGSGTINAWKWDFGDGVTNTTTVGSTPHSFNLSGIFPVSLIVTDVNSCTSNTTVSLEVKKSPVAGFSASSTFQCKPPLDITFNNTSQIFDSAIYSWNFGDNTTSTQINPQHTFTTSGSYNVVLTVSQGKCSNTLIKPKYIVVQNIKADFNASKTTACEGDDINFTEISSLPSANRTWDFGDGTTSTQNNPTHAYTAGTYTVKLMATDVNSCMDSITKTSYIVVNPKPVVNFSANKTTSCSFPFTVTFTDNSTNAAAWNWDFGDGKTSNVQNPVHVYATKGNYTVTLTVTSANNCSVKLTKPSYIIIAPPVTNYTADMRQGCIPLSVNFTSTSSSPVDSIATYKWSLGDGKDSATTFPKMNYSYPQQGVYSTTLTITTVSGCKDSLKLTNYIKTGKKPTAKFNNDSLVCYGVTVKFQDSSVNVNKWLWDFGDGGTSQVQNPTHLYGDTGKFTVKLIVQYNGCPDTLIKKNAVTVQPPNPIFSSLLNCVNPYKVDFTSTSKGADSLVWNFGDGSIDSSNTKKPSHTYLSRGKKNVTLTAFNHTSGCSFSTSSSFTIAAPVAKFNAAPLTGCYPHPVTFTDSSQDEASRTWNYGDGSNGTLPSHTYQNPGTYNVKLTITDVNKCTDTLRKNNLITVFGAIPDFTTDNTTGCTPAIINFSDSSTTNSSILQWVWDYGDKMTDTIFVSKVAHNYSASGKYTVTMSATDTNNCTKSIKKTNLIWITRPLPAFTADTFSCQDKTISFNATATTAVSPTFNWDFGDTSIFSTRNTSASHTYTYDNFFAVKLTVTDTNKCDSAVIHNIRILQPTAKISDSTVSMQCGTKQIQFTDSSTGFVNKWQWSFGNGAASTLQNPSCTYTSPGTYSVSLIVQNIGGCIDTLVLDSFVVVPGPYGKFSFIPTSGCNPLTVSFAASSPNTIIYTYDFGDGTVVNTADTIIKHTYTKDIVTTPVVLLGSVLSDGTLCKLPATNLIGQVIVTTTVGITMPDNPLLLEDGKTIMINPTVTGVSNTTKYLWAPSSGLSCSDCPNPKVSSTGKDENYSFTVTDSSTGCIGQDSLSVLFLPCRFNFIIPNVMTPNGDTYNDVFKVDSLCLKYGYRLEIYNRWGMKIFSTTDRNQSWEGKTLNGEDSPSGVYYYAISLGEKTFRGFIQLIREDK